MPSWRPFLLTNDCVQSRKIVGEGTHWEEVCLFWVVRGEVPAQIPSWQGSLLQGVALASSAALGPLTPSILLQLEIQAPCSKPQPGLWLLQEVACDSFMTHVASFGFLPVSSANEWKNQKPQMQSKAEEKEDSDLYTICCFSRLSSLFFFNLEEKFVSVKILDLLCII